MKRKIFLLLSTFILMLLAFSTYSLFSPTLDIFDPTVDTRVMPDYPLDPEKGVQVKDMLDIVYYDRTRTGQLRGIYRVSEWTTEDDGSYLLKRPRLEARLSNGTRVYLTADRGWVWGEPLDAKSYNVSRGRLEGNVEIYIDQSLKLHRKHPNDRRYAKRMRETTRIHTNEVEFNQDMLEIRSPGQVTITSSRVDMVGRGLTIQWNDKPRELRLLRLDNGDILKLKGLSEQMDMIQLSTPKAKAKDTAEVHEPMGPPAPGAALAEKPEAATPAAPQDKLTPEELKEKWDLPTSATKPAETPAELATTSPSNIVLTTQPTSAPTGIVTLPDDEPAARNVFEATFKTKVRIFSGDRSLRGADFLRLKFEWEQRFMSDDDEEDEKEESTLASDAPGQPEGRIDEAADTQPATDAAEAAEKDLAEKSKDIDDGDVLEIYWNGPLEIAPSGYTPTPDPDRYHIDGYGDYVLLTDPQARIICKEFEFENPQQEARFRGTRDDPARLILARGEEIVCRDQISFNRSKGLAVFKGPGSMKRFAEEAGDWEMDVLTPEEAKIKTVTEQVTWEKSVEATVVERKVTDEKGEKRTQPYISRAVFDQNVEMLQMPKAEQKKRSVGQNYVSCGWLEIKMDMDEENRINLTSAHARGKVRGYQEGSDVKAEDVQLFFRPRPKIVGEAAPETSDSADDDMLKMAGGRIEIHRILASGDIKLNYQNPKKPDEKPIHVVAETADVSMNFRGDKKREAKPLGVLTGKPGKPAVVRQDKNRLEGERIEFTLEDQDVRRKTTESSKIMSRMEVTVKGKGVFDLELSEDFSGQPLKNPRVYKVSWDKEMRMKSLEAKDANAADSEGAFVKLFGDVALDSRTETVRAENMRLYFGFRKDKDKKDKEKKAAKEAPEDESGRFGISLKQFEDLFIRQAIAEGGRNDENVAQLQRRVYSEVNPIWMIQRSDLRGNKIIAMPSEHYAVVNGVGSLLLEDYQPPLEKKEKDKAKNKEMASFMERPCQALFKWHKQCKINLKDNFATMRGKVFMARSTGNMMDFKNINKNIKMQPLGKLKNGQYLQLNCGQLDLWLSKPTKDAELATFKSPILESDIQIGKPLKIFASQNVRLKQEASNGRCLIIDGQRAVYDFKTEVVSVWGYAEKATQKTDAKITIENAKTGLQQSYESPTLMYDRRNEKLKIGRLTGAGGM